MPYPPKKLKHKILSVEILSLKISTQEVEIRSGVVYLNGLYKEYPVIGVSLSIFFYLYTDVY